MKIRTIIGILCLTLASSAYASYSYVYCIENLSQDLILILYGKEGNSDMEEVLKVMPNEANTICVPSNGLIEDVTLFAYLLREDIENFDPNSPPLPITLDDVLYTVEQLIPGPGFIEEVKTRYLNRIEEIIDENTGNRYSVTTNALFDEVLNGGTYILRVLPSAS